MGKCNFQEFVGFMRGADGIRILHEELSNGKHTGVEIDKNAAFDYLKNYNAFCFYIKDFSEYDTNPPYKHYFDIDAELPSRFFIVVVGVFQSGRHTINYCEKGYSESPFYEYKERQ